MLGLSLGLQSAYNSAVCDVGIIFQRTTGQCHIKIYWPGQGFAGPKIILQTSTKNENKDHM